MNIHEYQAKEILARHGIKIPRGHVAFDLRDAEAAAQGIGMGPFIVKAQVHAGGRGKKGGIRKAKDPAEVREIARAMFGMRLITPQSGVGIMRILSFIQDREVIKAILKHLGLWLVKSKPVPYLIGEPTPKVHAPPTLNQYGSGRGKCILDRFSQLPMNDDHLHRDPEYPWDAYLQS